MHIDVIMIKVEQLSSCDGPCDPSDQTSSSGRGRVRENTSFAIPPLVKSLQNSLWCSTTAYRRRRSRLCTPPSNLIYRVTADRIARAIDGPGRRCRVNDCANSSRAVRHRHLAFNIMVLYYFILCSYTPVSRNNNIDFWNILCAALVVEYSARKHTLLTYALAKNCIGLLGKVINNFLGNFNAFKIILYSQLLHIIYVFKVLLH